MYAQAIQNLLAASIPCLLVLVAVIGLARLAVEKLYPATPEQKRQYREFVRQERIRKARQLTGLDRQLQPLGDRIRRD